MNTISPYGSKSQRFASRGVQWFPSPSNIISIWYQYEKKEGRRVSETKCVAYGVYIPTGKTLPSIPFLAKGNCIRRIGIKIKIKKKKSRNFNQSSAQQVFGRMLVAFWNHFTHVIWWRSFMRIYPEYTERSNGLCFSNLINNDHRMLILSVQEYDWIFSASFSIFFFFSFISPGHIILKEFNGSLPRTLTPPHLLPLKSFLMLY